MGKRIDITNELIASMDEAADIMTGKVPPVKLGTEHAADELPIADECRRQCEIVNAFEQTPEGRAEAEAWEHETADAWSDLPPYEV